MVWDRPATCSSQARAGLSKQLVGILGAPFRLVCQGEVDALRRLLADRLGWDFDVSELGGLEEDDEDAPVVVQL